MTPTSNPQVVDLIILAFLGLAALIGFISGFTRLILGIGGWIGAIAAGFFSIPLLKPFVMNFIHNELLASIISGCGVFIIVLSLLVFLGRSVSSAVKSSSLGGVDRSLGLVFGIILAGATMSGLFSFTPTLLPQEQYDTLMKNSKLSPYLQLGSDFLKDFISKLLGRNLTETPSSPESSKSLDAALEKLASPPPKLEHKQGEKGYSGDVRHEMDKLFEEEASIPEAGSSSPTSTVASPNK